MQQNHHELIVLAPEEIAGLYLTAQVKNGKLPPAKADELMKGTNESASAEQRKAWKDYVFNQYSSFGVGNVGTWQSALVLQRMIRDFGGVGQFVIREYRGTPYVIFKGYAGLRRIISGTRYGLAHPKIVELGIEHLGCREIAMAGARVTFIAVLAYRALEYVMKDEVMLGRRIANLASDVVKISIAAGVGYAALVMTGTLVSAAIGPLLGVVIIGVLVSAGLEYIDQKYGLTEKLAEKMDLMLEDISRKVDDGISDLERKVKRAVVSAAASASEWLIKRGVRMVVDYISRQAVRIF